MRGRSYLLKTIFIIDRYLSLYSSFFFFFLMIRPPPRSPLFPSPPLSRSVFQVLPYLAIAHRPHARHARREPIATAQPLQFVHQPGLQHGVEAPGDAFVQRFALRQKRRSEEHTSELQSQSNLVCRLLLEKK